MTRNATRVSYLQVQEMHALDLACSRLHEAFHTTPVLVGSVMDKPDFRDVDVRILLPDAMYAKLNVETWTILGFTVSAWLSSMTGGLPIDFQFQQATAANEKFDGKRNPLGLRTLASFRGDAPASASAHPSGEGT